MKSALEKGSCDNCGYGFHLRPLSARDRNLFYDETYDIGLRDPEADDSRARDYADHLETVLCAQDGIFFPGMSVVEFGCGSGALLNHLAERWPLGDVLGVEPAAKLAETARMRATGNMEIVEAYAETCPPLARRYDLAISINAVEHALDPVEFLAACRRAVGDEGTVAIVCPDGDEPNSELLFRDHVSSFSTSSFALAAAKADLALIASARLTGRQTGFRLFLLRQTKDPPRSPHPNRYETLSAGRRLYLDGWRDLEQAALQTIGHEDFAIFGIGEYADLLNAYCPGLVERAKFYVSDNPSQGERDGLPVLSLDEARRHGRITLLAAVNPRSWPALKERFDPLGQTLLHPYQFSKLRSNL